ncbi:hypothetical protein BC827DRAFT_1151676 [Russula dissimulans]|nr:hypothetical protein BC827DRAFT_1151676 [Russula dissimulans]
MFSGWPSLVIAIVVHNRTGAMDDMARQAMRDADAAEVWARESAIDGWSSIAHLPHVSLAMRTHASCGHAHLACLPTHLHTQPTRPRTRMPTHLATCLLRVAHAGTIPLAVGMGNPYSWPRVRVRIKVTCEDHYGPALQIEARIEPWLESHMVGLESWAARGCVRI